MADFPTVQFSTSALIGFSRISPLSVPLRMRRTTRWRRSSASPSTRTTRPSRCRRCQRKPPPASCLARWTSSWTTTSWTPSNLGTECRWWEPSAACRARRAASPLAPSGEAGVRRRKCRCSTNANLAKLSYVYTYNWYRCQGIGMYFYVPVPIAVLVPITVLVLITDISADTQ